jgi:hypothetical protein
VGQLHEECVCVVEQVESLVWSELVLYSVEGVAEMSALGLGLDRGTFKDAGKYGPHLLAPTASDLKKYGKKDTILAGFHSVLNFL